MIGRKQRVDTIDGREEEAHLSRLSVSGRRRDSVGANRQAGPTRSRVFPEGLVWRQTFDYTLSSVGRAAIEVAGKERGERDGS